MGSIFRLFEKSEKIIIGILSGTSLDGVDVVLTKISGFGETSKIEVMDFYTNPYPAEMKQYILKCSSKDDSSVEDICKLNFLLGYFFSNSVLTILRNNNLEAKDVDLIGSHGQTVYHMPVSEKMFSYDIKSTLQLGDPSVIANITGINTVGDFRIADVAVGGDGAPLVPYMDYILFGNKNFSRVLINIGGISNITYLKKHGKLEDVIAFDTGPGNMLIDGVMRKLYQKEYDFNGAIASKGRINKKLFDIITDYDKYLKLPPPKSTGRELYNENFINFILENSVNIIREDIIRTITEYTTYSIFKGISDFISDNQIQEILVSGGGALNAVIMESLSHYFKGINVNKLEYNGITTDNKEAVLFAILANEAINGNRANIKSVTNAGKNVILGKICLAN